MTRPSPRTVGRHDIDTFDLKEDPTATERKMRKPSSRTVGKHDIDTFDLKEDPTAGQLYARRDELDQAYEVARYAELGFSQEEIAQTLGITKVAAWRRWQIAVQYGLFVSMAIPPLERDWCETLRRQLKLKLAPKLIDAIVVPGRSELLFGAIEPLARPPQRNRRSKTQSTSLSQPRDTHDPRVAESMIRAMRSLVLYTAARKTAAWLENSIASYEGGDPSLSLSWGRSVKAVSQFFTYQRRLPGLRVTPMVGMLSAVNPNPFEANHVALEVAAGYGSRSCYSFAAPAVIHKNKASTWKRSLDSLRKQMLIAPVLKEICNATHVLLSVAPANAYDGLLQFELLNEEDKLRIPATASGECGGFYYNSAGPVEHPTIAPVAMDFQSLANIAKRNGKVIAMVAGASSEKVKAALDAVEVGIVNVLALDHVGAQHILEILEKS